MFFNIVLRYKLILIHFHSKGVVIFAKRWDQRNRAVRRAGASAAAGRGEPPVP